MPGLRHSSTKKPKNPSSSRVAVRRRTMLVWRVTVRVLRHRSRSSQTTKPSPPRIIRSITGRVRSQFPAKAVREAKGVPSRPIRSKPALQKAETEVKAEAARPSRSPSRGTKVIASSAVPKSSTRKVPRITVRTRWRTPAKESLFTDSLARSAARRPIRRPTRTLKKAPMVTRPRPPICIRARIIPCPRPDQWLQVS